MLPDPEIEAPFWADHGWWRRAGQASIGAYGATLFAFMGTVVAARSLGPSDYGSVVLALSVTVLVSTFLELTLEEAVVFHGSRELEGNHRGRLRGLVRTAMLIDLTLGTLIAGSLALAAGPIASAVSGGRLDPALVRLAAIGVVGLPIEGTFGAMLLLARRPDLRGWGLFATGFFRFGFVLAAVRLGGPRQVTGAFVAAEILGVGFAGLLVWRVAWKRWRTEPREGGFREWARPLVTFGFHSTLTSSAFAAKEALVPTVLGRLAGPTTVGIIDVALFPLKMAGVASGPIRFALLPEQARLSAKGDIERLRRSVRGYTAWGLAIGIPGAIAGWFLIPHLLPALYSKNFSAAIAPSRIALVAAVAFLATGWAKTLPAAVGRPQVRSRVAALELGLTLAALIVLAPRGTIGAAAAVAISSGLVGIVWWVMGNRILRGEARRIAELRQDAPASADTRHPPPSTE